LDMSSLVIKGATHALTPQIDGRVVRFNFYNIMLADSFSNEPKSHGSVSYTIKLKPNLPLGTQIKNTAHIFFDNNSPIVTNTTLHTLFKPASINSIQIAKYVKLYPNPTNSNVVLEKENATDVVEYQLYNHLGSMIIAGKMQGPATTINMANCAAGLYLVKVSVNGEVGVLKVVKE
jgi:hypothetical protein